MWNDLWIFRVACTNEEKTWSNLNFVSKNKTRQTGEGRCLNAERDKWKRTDADGFTTRLGCIRRYKRKRMKSIDCGGVEQRARGLRYWCYQSQWTATWHCHQQLHWWFYSHNVNLGEKNKCILCFFSHFVALILFYTFTFFLFYFYLFWINDEPNWLWGGVCSPNGGTNHGLD